MEGRFCYKEVIPFTALVAIECTNVGADVLFKAASEKGLSYYVLIVYSFAVSTFALLLLLPFVSQRSGGLPPLKMSLIFRIFLLGLIGFLVQLCGYKGLKYTSPTLSSALSNLIPAFTFILAAFFRMEKVALRTRSTQAKILGTALSISGALIVVFYKGHTILSASYQQQSPTVDSQLSSSSQSNWVLGGSLLAFEFLLTPIWYITQASIMKQYPSEITVVFLFNLCGTLISAPVCILLEANLDAWKINPDISLIAIIYAGVLCTGLSSLVQTWGLHLKGPLYVSIFKPLSIFIATTLSIILLGDVLYLGTVVGAIILSFGFYAVVWGKAKEEEFGVDFGEGRTQTPSVTKTPLLQSVNVKDNKEIMYNNC